MGIAMPKKFDLIRIDAVGFGVCALVSLAVHLAWVHPFLEQRALQIKQRSALAAQRQEGSRLSESLAAARGQLEVIAEELARSRFDIDSVDHINKRIAALTTFFSDCQLSVDNVQAGDPHNGQPYLVVPISVTGTGTCRQCTRFLHRFAREFADMSVAAIALTGSPAKVGGQESFQLELLWHAAPVANEGPTDPTGSAQDMVSKL